MNNALLVIDFINDIVHPDGKISSSAAHTQQQNAIYNANLALSHAREHDWLTILIKVGFDENYHLQPKNSPMFGMANQYKALQLGSWGTEFHSSLDVQPCDFVIEKPRVSGFYATPLDTLLRANKVEHLYLCGVSTTWAIESTVRDAHDRDYLVTVIENACSAKNEQTHQKSIEALSHIAQIITVDQISH